MDVGTEPGRLEEKASGGVGIEVGCASVSGTGQGVVGNGRWWCCNSLDRSADGCKPGFHPKPFPGGEG